MDLGRQSLSNSLSGRSTRLLGRWASDPCACASESANPTLAANAAAEYAINCLRFIPLDLISLLPDFASLILLFIFLRMRRMAERFKG